LKTLGEYGYLMPREMRHIPRKYWNHDVLDIGWEILDEDPDAEE